MCSNNNCTTCTDWCLAKSCEEINEEKAVPILPYGLSDYSVEGREAVVDTLIYVRNILQDLQSEKIYPVIDYIHPFLEKFYGICSIKGCIDTEKISMIVAIEKIIDKLQEKQVIVA